MLPALRREWALGDGGSAALTIAVQLGFIVGTLAARSPTCPTCGRPRRVMVGRRVVGALANGLAGAGGGRPRRRPSSLRFVTGVAMAGALSAGDEDHGHVVPRGPRPGHRYPRRRPDGRLGHAAPDARRHRPAVAPDAARRLGLALLAAGLVRGVRARGGTRFPGRASTSGWRRRSSRARPAPGVLRLLRPHVGALRDVGVDRPVPGREPARRAAAAVPAPTRAPRPSR